MLTVLYVGRDEQKCPQNNWGNKVKELALLFESWKKENHQYSGKHVS
jgi:hypothetical protein